MVGWDRAKPEIAPLRVAMRGRDAGAAAEGGSPRSPDLYDFADDSDYAAAAAASSDHTVLFRPSARTHRSDKLDSNLVHLACSRARFVGGDCLIRSLVLLGPGGLGLLYSYYVGGKCSCL